MKAKVIFSKNQTTDGGCAGGTCPTIYETERGTYLIQGKKLNEIFDPEFNIPEGEAVIEIPKEFLDGFKKS